MFCTKLRIEGFKSTLICIVILDLWIKNTNKVMILDYDFD